MKRPMIYFGIALIAYLLMAVVTYWVMMPPLPQWEKIFRPGNSYVSQQEGVEQTVMSLEGDKVFVSCKILPHAAGPPEHLHETFDETFSVKSGVLSLMVEGQKMTLSPGDSYTVKRGQYHKFWNDTDKPVVLEDRALALPLTFALTLSQLYGIINERPEVATPPKILLQMAAFRGDFDSYIKAGPPPPLMKALCFLLSPVAQLGGYEYANPKFFPSHSSSFNPH